MVNLNELLEKNPDAREIFKKNRRKLEQFGRQGVRKSAGCGLALPYSGDRTKPTVRANGEVETDLSA